MIALHGNLCELHISILVVELATVKEAVAIAETRGCKIEEPCNFEMVEVVAVVDVMAVNGGSIEAAFSNDTIIIGADRDCIEGGGLISIGVAGDCGAVKIGFSSRFLGNSSWH
uniref:Uncharacterized protein n=1 Tax=Romanomermis culicivorax TaxID=13658 RepID=A0A915IYL1_ROMCU